MDDGEFFGQQPRLVVDVVADGGVEGSSFVPGQIGGVGVGLNELLEVVGGLFLALRERGGDGTRGLSSPLDDDQGRLQFGEGVLDRGVDFRPGDVPRQRRMTKRTPNPLSKMISGAARESAQVRITAIGRCP